MIAGLAALMAAGILAGRMEAELDRKARRCMTPSQYAGWRDKRDAEETAERRHQEMLRAIRDAGESAGRFR